MTSTAATLLFEIGGHLCGLSTTHVREIVFLPALTKLAGQPSILEGFMNLRGEAVPVVRLDRLFALPPGPAGAHAPLIILSNSPRPTALLADRVKEVAALDGAELRTVEPRESFNRCALAEFDFGGRAATLLDPDRLLLEKERQCAAELSARVQAEIDAIGTPAQ